MENEINVTNVAEEAIESNVLETGFNGKNLVKASVVVLCVGAAVAGVVIAKRKLKGKLEAMKTKKDIERLEKQGYTVINCSEDIFDEEHVEVNPTEE